MTDITTDISSIKDYISIIKDIVLTGVAIYGFGAWRRQLKSNTEYELTKKLLKAIYELRDSIASIRHPLSIYSGEPDLPDEKLKALSPEEKIWHSMVQAYQKKWESVSKVKLEFDINLLEAEVIWGRKVHDKVVPLNKLIVELFCAIKNCIELRQPNGNNSSSFSKDEIKAMNDTLYASFGKKDKYKEELESVIKSIEEELKPHIKKYHR